MSDYISQKNVSPVVQLCTKCCCMEEHPCLLYKPRGQQENVNTYQREMDLSRPSNVRSVPIEVDQIMDLCPVEEIEKDTIELQNLLGLNPFRSDYSTAKEVNVEKYYTNGTSNNSSPDQIIERKQRHSTVEKRRRLVIANRIKELRNLLSDHIRKKSMSKIEILKESINFIVMLEQAQKSLPYLEKKLGEVNIKMRKMKSQLQTRSTRTNDWIPNTSQQQEPPTRKPVGHQTGYGTRADH
ncbi:uncharacterized protein LOC132729102 [Ruditapes philippinarum]|uniref:uncharacterized protein LOC132729102 n=1 Tax=Ruditapes philippinarum TaxID=129788 RepID=UPI00295B739F|nr:uncharacterized protein LOC132729102 [Ruditapes philippinarum]